MNRPIDAIVTNLAKKHFNVATLQDRGRDHLDFYDISVSAIKAALIEAYESGLRKGYDCGYVEAKEGW